MFLLNFLLLAAQLPLPDFSEGKQIAMQNAILTKVNGKTISMLDVRKKMDMIFHQNYPDLIESPQARLQYYEMTWRQVLQELIDNELILADASSKEIKLTDGEIREEMEARFGPNVMRTLEKIGLSYDETWNMVENEMIVRRMTWWFVHSRALSAVTPQDIRQAYRAYLEKNPAYQEWTYRVISVKDETLVEPVQALLEKENKILEHKDVHVSQEYIAKTQDLSESHRKILNLLEPGQYSSPVFQTSRFDKAGTHRIFQLVKKEDHPATPFEAIADQLRSELIQQAVGVESKAYLEKLRQQHGYTEAVPQDLHPFSLQ